MTDSFFALLAFPSSLPIAARQIEKDLAGVLEDNRRAWEAKSD